MTAACLQLWHRGHRAPLRNTLLRHCDRRAAVYVQGGLVDGREIAVHSELYPLCPKIPAEPHSEGTIPAVHHFRAGCSRDTGHRYFGDVDQIPRLRDRRSQGIMTLPFPSAPRIFLAVHSKSKHAKNRTCRSAGNAPSHYSAGYPAIQYLSR